MELIVRQLANPVTSQFRRRHLHGAVTPGGMALAAERLFEEFFELEWVFDHRYGAASHVLASAAAALLERRGWPARVACCEAEVRKGTRTFHFGVKDWAGQAQLGGHAVCLVGETLLLDFALADARRNFDRAFPWGIVSALGREEDQVAALDIPGHGRMRWSGEEAVMGPAQAMKVATLVPRLLLEHAAAFGAH